MSLRRRGGVWWIDVGAPNGERIRRTTGTANKALAQEFHDCIKVELWRIDKLGVKPKRTWNDAVVRWLKENGHKATASEDVTKLRWLDRYLRDRDLAAIDRTLIDHVTREKLAEGWKNATANRTLELLRAVLRKCVNEWEWLDRAPYVRMLKELELPRFGGHVVVLDPISRLPRFHRSYTRSADCRRRRQELWFQASEYSWARS